MITTDFLPREETKKQVKIGVISSLLIEIAIQFITWPYNALRVWKIYRDEMEIFSKQHFYQN